MRGYEFVACDYPSKLLPSDGASIRVTGTLVWHPGRDDDFGYSPERYELESISAVEVIDNKR